MKIAFIGGGNMGEAMLSAILDKGLSRPSAISVSDTAEARRQYLEQKYGVAVMSSNLLHQIQIHLQQKSLFSIQFCLQNLSELI